MLADGLGRPNIMVAMVVNYPALRIVDHSLWWVVWIPLLAVTVHLTPLLNRGASVEETSRQER
jgi:hypothetical protein